jgi:hypothetical protein
MLRSDIDEPHRRKSNTEIALPNLPKERTDKLDPDGLCSFAETLDPTRTALRTERDDPIVAISIREVLVRVRK